MVHPVILPRLGTNMDEGTIVEWRKAPGEAVRAGEVLLLVETTKSIFEVESEHDGYLRKHLREEGEEVLFTEPVALVTDLPDEEVSDFYDGSSIDEPVPHRYADAKRDELFGRGADTGEAEGMVEPGGIPVLADAVGVVGVPDATAATVAGRIPASPAARRRMREAGIQEAEFNADPERSVMTEADVVVGLDESRVAIYGAGLGAKQVMELIRATPGLAATVLYDDDQELWGKKVLGLTVRGGMDRLIEDAEAEAGKLTVAVSLHSEYRRKVIEKIRNDAPEVNLRPLVDSRAIVCSGVVISDAAIVEAGSVIGPDTFIGEGVIVDVGAVIAHDCHIGAHTHLSPGCTISGVVKIEDNVLVGVGAAINSQVIIGKNTVITPGTAVVSDIEPDVVVSGNPGRIIGKSFRGR